MTRVQAVLRDLWRTFFADPVRENVVRSHGGGATAVSMVLLGLAAFAVAVLGVVLASSIGATPVGPGTAVLANDAEPGLPVTIPTYFFPTYIALTLVSTFLGIFGAVYATRALAVVAVLFIFLCTSTLAGFAWSFRETAWPAYVALPVAVAIPMLVLLLRWRTPSPPVVQVVSCAAALLAVVPAAWTQIDVFTTAGTSGGTALMARQAELIIFQLAFLVTPAPLLAGAAAVSFGRTVTDFLARAVETLVGRRRLLFVAAFLVLLAARVLASAVSVLRADNTSQASAKAVLLALVLVAAASWWAWATRGFDETPDEVEEGSARGTIPVVGLLLGLLIMVPGALGVVVYLEASFFDSLTTIVLFNNVNELVGRHGVATTTQILTGVLLAAWAVWAARREPSVVAAWVGIAGVVIAAVVMWNALVSDRAWGLLGATDYARAALLVVTVATVRELVRWRVAETPPSSAWTVTAFSAVALTALVAQGSFLDDPFRPILGFTGAGLVFFGLVWGFLTAGAHSSATGLAGMGRTTVMLSYAVVTTLLIAWGDTTGGAVGDALSGALAVAGKAILGTALLVALLAVWIPILFGLAEPAVRPDESPDSPKPHPDAEAEWQR